MQAAGGTPRRIPGTRHDLDVDPEAARHADELGTQRALGMRRGHQYTKNQPPTDHYLLNVDDLDGMRGEYIEQCRGHTRAVAPGDSHQQRPLRAHTDTPQSHGRQSHDEPIAPRAPFHVPHMLTIARREAWDSPGVSPHYRADA